MRLVRPLMTNLKMTVRFDWTVFCGYPLPHTHTLSIKALTACLSRVGEVSLWTDIHHLPPPQLPASEIKQTFLCPTWPVYWLWSGKEPDPQPLLVT